MTLVLGLAPVLAHAAPPSVTGLRASLNNGQVTVSWSASPDPTVSYYRVYWSRKSILQNEGKWDDFETTQGKDTSYTLQSFPAAPEIFIGVMAVTTYGEESPVFTEEVMVNLGGTPASASSSSSSSSSKQQAATSSSSSVSTTTLDLLSAQALSATGVVLTFSQPVMVSAEEAARAFTIIDASGAFLPIYRLTIQGPNVTLATSAQRKDMTYNVVTSSVLHAAEGDATVNPNKSKAIFWGHVTGLTPENAHSQSSLPAVQDVSRLHVNGTQMEDGSYIVTATWEPYENVANIAAYQIFQTPDGGKTWGQAQTVPANTTSIRVSSVPPGSFGILVKVVGKNGLASLGTFGSIDLPGFTANPPPIGTVTPPIIPPTTPVTGPASVVLFAMAGALVGVTEIRRWKTRFAVNTIS